MNSDEAHEFVQRWQKAGPALEKICREELRNYRYEDHIAEIASLFVLGAQGTSTRMTSGLVEQQRLFQKARR